MTLSMTAEPNLWPLEANGHLLAGRQRAVVDLPPGTYEFTNRTGVRGHDPHESFPAALVTFRRVED